MAEKQLHNFNEMLRMLEATLCSPVYLHGIEHNLVQGQLHLLFQHSPG